MVNISSDTNTLKGGLNLHKPATTFPVEIEALTDSFSWHPIAEELLSHLAAALMTDPGFSRLGNGWRQLGPKARACGRIEKQSSLQPPFQSESN